MRILITALIMSIQTSQAETLEERLAREKAAMDSLEAALAKDRKVLDQTALQKLSTGALLTRLQKKKVQTRRDLRGLVTKERNLQSRLTKTRDALAVAERDLEKRKAGIADRLRLSYKLSRKDPLSILLSGKSLTEGLRRLTYLGKAAEQDRVDMAALAASRETVRKNLKLRQIQYAHQHTLVRATQRKQNTLQSTVTDYNTKLRSLKRREYALKVAIQETNEEKVRRGDRIAELIKETERQRLAGRRLAKLPEFDFAGKKGQIPWPVRGKILTHFGRAQDPDLGTWTVNRGVTIGAESGKDVLAIAPGEVMLIDWWRGYGQLVLLRHSAGYYTLYSHLASRSVEVGEILNEGALIGTVGNTGRLDGVPQLHFEIMKEEQALDPTAWLEP